MTVVEDSEDDAPEGVGSVQPSVQPSSSPPALAGGVAEHRFRIRGAILHTGRSLDHGHYVTVVHCEDPKGGKRVRDLGGREGMIVIVIRV